MAGDRPPVSASAFWEGLYASSQDGWELGEPAPSLAAWIAAGGAFGPAARVAVPGAGRGHDARLLARHGYAVTGFDFAEAAIAEARRLAERESVTATFEQRDVFGLGSDFAQVFDAVWEYTCFCAIDPDRRVEYARVLHDILKPGGSLLACFYPMKEGVDGPPFPVSRAGIEVALAPFFDIVEGGPPRVSPERRRGLEWMVTARRRSS
ncbi:MAG TPA: methyltransferase domain-containing protein [Candidatus Eisenbacteria bacterium]|nr:methyltransferase domain-containing protein [Candidatus Eisenbacteria bacterium]